MVITPCDEWKDLVSGLVRGTVLIIGNTDSGKSTLARYMLEALLERGRVTAFVDADIGQSSLGLPGTISMKVFRSPGDLEDFAYEKIYFVGSFTPASCVAAMIEGTARMVNEAKREGARTILVDTTGLVKGELGLALKAGKARAIRPRHVIAIEAAGELHPIMPLMKGVILHRLVPSRFVRQRTREARVRYREEKLAAYFAGSRSLLLPRREVECFRHGRTYDISLSPPAPGTLVGLNRGEATVALGRFEGIVGEAVKTRAPLSGPRGLDRLLIGDVMLESST